MAEIIAENVGIRFAINRKQRKSGRDVVIKGRRAGSSQQFWALRDVSFAIPAGEVVGIMGPNGSGKTTLLKLIGGVMEPDEGALTTTGTVASMISLGAGFSPALTAAENIYLTGAIYGLSRKEIDSRFDDIVAFAEIEGFLDTPIRHFSSGMKVRLGFSVIREVSNPIVLLDEVMAVGDQAFRKKVFQHVRSMKDEGRTLVIVSHRAKNIRKLCSRTVVLEHGRVSFDGNTAAAIRHYQNLVDGS